MNQIFGTFGRLSALRGCLVLFVTVAAQRDSKQFFLTVAKKLSITALSQQSPHRLMLQIMPRAVGYVW
jgi:hypothetical protein